MKKLYTTICAVSLLIAIKPAAAQGVFEIGPHIGFSKFSVDVEESSGSAKISDPALGLTARYTVPVGDKDKGMFVGLEASATREFASDKETYTGLIGTGDEAYDATITSETSVNWSIDVLPRVGYDFGKVSINLAAGVSFVRGEREASISILDERVSASDTNWHTGWKIAPGIDYELTENVTLFGQAHYARYGSETYTFTADGVSVESKTKPKVWGTRVGVLYRF